MTQRQREGGRTGDVLIPEEEYGQHSNTEVEKGGESLAFRGRNTMELLIQQNQPQNYD